MKNLFHHKCVRKTKCINEVTLYADHTGRKSGEKKQGERRRERDKTESERRKGKGAHIIRRWLECVCVCLCSDST